MRENEQLKQALAKLEAKLAADRGEVGKLERQIKGAKTRIKNLEAQLHIVAEAAKAKGKLMERSERMAIVKCLHEDQLHDDIKKGSRTASETGEAIRDSMPNLQRAIREVEGS